MENDEGPTITGLQNELDFYRNHSVMDEEIRTVIGDNQKLSQQVGQLLRDKLWCVRQHGHGDSNDDSNQLRAQLNLLAKERDSLHVLWQTSQKTIDALENELKFYQSYNSRDQQKNIDDNTRGKDLKLETALTDYLELETKYKTLELRFSNLENELKNKEAELATCIDKSKRFEIKLEEITKTLDECRINLAAEEKSNADLKSQLSSSRKDVVDLVKKEAEAKSKVAEALQLFDVVSSQKNDAYNKIKEVTGELLDVKHALAHATRDAESNYRRELDDIKDKYNEKITDMLTHIKNLDSELVEKGMLLNKAMREIKILKEENDGFLKQQKDTQMSIDPKLQLAEQRLEAMFQELVASERRNIQIVCEKQCLALEMQRTQDVHTREIKRRDWEEGLLKTQCEELKAQVEHLQKSLDDTHGMIEKLQKMLSSRNELNQKMVSTKEEELLELNKHLENQMELSRKWKESYVEMAEKLKKRLIDLAKENKELRTQLKMPTISSSENSSS